MSVESSTETRTAAPAATSHRAHRQGQEAPTAEETAQAAGSGRLGVAMGVVVVWHVPPSPSIGFLIYE